MSSAAVIQANYEQLEAISQRFEERAQAMGELRRGMAQRVDALRGEGWVGKGADQFVQEMEGEVLPACQRLSEALAEASKVTLQIRDILRSAEEEAAALFAGEMVAANEEGKGFWGHVGDFFSGMWAEGKDMVTGLWTAVTHPIETAKGLWYGITHPGELWEAIKQPYVEDWNNGRPWRAIGRGTMAILTTVLGAKGLDKLAKGLRGASLADDVARAGNVVDDAARLGSVADDAARAGSVVDDAGRMGRFVDEAGNLTSSVDDVASSILQESAERTVTQNNLISELAENGIKHAPDEIVAVTRDPSGKVVFLETGSTSAVSPRPAGLKHILEEHAGDFARRGIPPQQIPDVIMDAVEHGKIVGYQGRGTGRPIYEVVVNGEVHRIAITVGDNGFVVGANPVSVP
ncbi:MAG: WXG100 family type VII secretion target [Anaerolineales bacterium]|nr:WXG100 family type VII secretion target [Anaerolineales bacterium]MCB9129077.1 WXG100 family type VII secretion target [Ardenticatenales bacterium]MCB9172771.1 WXG100 family type VII secretion target [Ardenticatenales bacterium]